MEKLLAPMILLLSTSLAMENTTNYQAKLINDLLQPSRYDIDAKPKRNASQAVVAAFIMQLSQINYLDMQKGALKLSLILAVLWQDDYLRWTPSEYGHTRQVRMRMHRIWHPDFVIMNWLSVEEMNIMGKMATVTSEGEVALGIKFLSEVSCGIDARFFPADTQECQLTLEVWTYDVTDVDINPNSDILGKHMVQNGEFQVVDLKAEYKRRKYPGAQHPFATIQYTIVLRRLPLYYIINLLIPLFLLEAIVVLILFVPTRGTEKVSLYVKVLLGLSILLTVFSDEMPVTSKQVPYISLLSTKTFVFACLGTLVATIQANLERRRDHNEIIPVFLQRIIQCKQRFSKSRRDFLDGDPTATTAVTERSYMNGGTRRSCTETQLRRKSVVTIYGEEGDMWVLGINTFIHWLAVAFGVICIGITFVIYALLAFN